MNLIVITKSVKILVSLLHFFFLSSMTTLDLIDRPTGFISLFLPLITILFTKSPSRSTVLYVSLHQGLPLLKSKIVYLQY